MNVNRTVQTARYITGDEISSSLRTTSTKTTCVVTNLYHIIVPWDLSNLIRVFGF